MTCCAIRGATALRTPPTKCAGRALFDEDATPCAPSVLSGTRTKQADSHYSRRFGQPFRYLPISRHIVPLPLPASNAVARGGRTAIIGWWLWPASFRKARFTA